MIDVCYDLMGFVAKQTMGIMLDIYDIILNLVI